MSLEQPSFRASSNRSTDFISSSSQPYNPMAMAAATQPASAGITISPPLIAPPATDWGPSQPRSSSIPDLMNEELQNSAGADANSTDVDPQILEALRSKDRLWVLKLGELMESLINERKAPVDVAPSTSYQRLLVHRCSSYYKLSPENDPLAKNVIIVSLAPDSRIPARRISELVPAESTAQPAFKIMMRRMPSDRNRRAHSQAGSVAGDEGDFSDSETGSLGGRSNASKRHLTIEQREAAYNEARTRIFMDFQEKEKEKDMSAGSSTQSLLSGFASTSAGGRNSSMEDLNESVGTSATDSEWSVPIVRDRKDTRGGSIAGSSSRSLRSAAPPFNVNGQNSSRRATSPSFTYASLYEPPPSVAPYDPLQAAGKGPVFVPQYQYGYQLPGNTPYGQQAYMGSYTHHPGYNFPQSAQIDPANSNGQEIYMAQQQLQIQHQQHQQQPVQYAPYPNPYVWANAHQPPGISQQSHSLNHTHQHQNHTHIAAQSTPQFTGSYVQPSSYAPYPAPGYYPPPPGQQIPPPHMMSQPIYSADPRTVHALSSGNGRNGHENIMAPQHDRAPMRNGGGHVAGGSSKRGAPPARAAWSYGPGISIGGFGYGNPSGMATGEVVGSRLNSTVRRMSQTSSVGSSSTGNRTPAGDEASSTASSSTTSSSSRRTYTSTTSSQHPLPPRPDWAVGLKPQPTLHVRNHDHSASSSRSSPARHAGQLHSTPMTPVVLQSTDFPPLNPVSPPPEKRTPVVGGAWGNASSTRSILQANVLPGAMPVGGRLEDPDRGFERPPPKSNAELFNPKTSRRSTSSNSRKNSFPQDRVDEQSSNDVPADVIDQLSSMYIGDAGVRSPSAAEIVAARKESPVVA